MGAVSTTLDERARSIFNDLGYTVSGSGREFRAERAWKVVRVTAAPEPTATPGSGELRCFVTYREQSRQLREQIRRLDPDYEWAIIAVDRSSGDYTVDRAPRSPVSA